MKTILSFLACLFLVLPLRGQVISQFPEKYTILPSDVFLVSTPGVATYKTTLLTLASNLNGYITVTATVTNALASGSNLATTNATSFGLFYRVNNLTNIEFFNIKQGTNIVLYRDGSNVVINATGGGGSGEVTTVQLNAASNAVLVISSSYDTTTSNGLFSVETTRNAAVSNALATLLVANDTTTSNGVYATETTRNAAVSNALVTLALSTPRTNMSVYVSLTDYGDLFVSTNVWVTNKITSQQFDTSDFNANTLVLTNALGSNQVRMGQQDLTNYSYNPFIITGTGGANTNFVLMAKQPEVVINGFTNVSMRAVMGYESAKVDYIRVTMTNGSGADTTLQFAPNTNDWRFAGVYGTNAPSLLTNMTQLHATMRVVNTNVLVIYDYAPWP